jgi:hypothetical protein
VPRVKPAVPGRRPFWKGEAVRAISAAFVMASDGEHFVHTGDRYSADHEVVQAIPACFIPDDLPANEVSGWLPEIDYPEQDRSQFNIAEPREIPDERKVICLEGLGDFTETIARGQVIDAGHRFVSQWPGYFSAYRPLTPEDVERLTK